MSSLHQFKLPDVGEGLTEADILRWEVAVGDVVVVNQTLVEVETAKAAVELPSPYAGVVHALHVEAGQTVEVGTPIITIDADGVAGSTPASSAPSSPAPSPAEAVAAAPTAATDALPAAPATAAAPAAPAREAVLVGYGVGGRGSRRRRPSAQAVFDRPGPEATAAAGAVPPAVPAELEELPVDAPARRAGGPLLAKPPVRQLARALGVDLATVTATGPHGSVSRADVEAAARTAAAALAPPVAAAAASAPATPVAPAAAVPASAPGAGQPDEERIPVRGVRKHTAAAMVSSAFTAPHVTEFVTVDVTETMALRDRVAARREFAGLKVSPLLFVARALLLAVPRTPVVNASWVDDGRGGAEIVVRRRVNLGIAAATDRGLIVPHIPDAHTLSLAGLAAAIGELTATARSGRTTPARLSGGTITITNIGVFGIDTGTPILNPGEAAILAVGAVRRAPWVVERDGVETLEPRWVTQLALSFDHRLVDGAEGSQFLADIAAVLRDPGLALL